MLFTFKIEQNDFLTFQLYTVSKSTNVVKTRLRGRILTSVAGLLLSINLFVTGSSIAATIMLGIAIGTYALYPKYHKWRLKKHFEKYSKKNYGTHFGQEESLETHTDYLVSKNISGEGKIDKSELEALTEIGDYFFLKMKNGSSIIIPKRFLKNPSDIENEIRKYGIVHSKELDWEY